MRFTTKLRTAVLSAFLVAGSAVAGYAATFNGIFSLSGTSFSEPGLVMGTSTQSGTLQFQLNVGQSTTIDLFDIWATEGRVVGNNTRQSLLQAAFTFASIGATGTANGVTQGISVTQGVRTTLQYGSLSWGSPILLNFGNGGLMSIALSSANFSAGVNGLTPGSANGATIQATATLIAAPVPLPASGLMLVGAIAGGTFWVRRRRRAA